MPSAVPTNWFVEADGVMPSAVPMNFQERVMPDPSPEFAKPVGTGPVWPVTDQTGPARFRFGPVPNWPKFKIQISIQKNEKLPKKIPKNTSRCDESNGVKFSQKFIHLV